MQANPGAFDTKLQSLMTAFRAAMARRVFAAVARGEQHVQEPKLAALSSIEVSSAGVLEVPACCPWPVAHCCSS